MTPLHPSATTNAAGSILIIEHSRAARTSTLKALEGLPHRLVEATDGFDALDKLSADTKCIVCAINMPRMNGIEFVQEAGRLLSPLPPVLIITSTAAPDLIRQAQETADVSWLAKPIQPASVRQAVEHLLQRHAA